MTVRQHLQGIHYPHLVVVLGRGTVAVMPLSLLCQCMFWLNLLVDRVVATYAYANKAL